jgi:Flp pilus assembly pilin Flp
MLFNLYVVLKRVIGDEEGATVAEYALVLALVVISLVAVLSALGQTLQDKIYAIIDSLS